VSDRALHLTGLLLTLLLVLLTWIVSLFKRDVSIVDSPWSLMFSGMACVCVFGGAPLAPAGRRIQHAPVKDIYQVSKANVFKWMKGADRVEHRYDRRLDMRKNILVHVNNSTYINGITRDISCSGLALASEQNHRLKKNAVVRAAFMADGQFVILPAQVVRVTEGEIALMFIEHASPRIQKRYDWLKKALRARLAAPDSERRLDGMEPVPATAKA